MNGRRMQGGRKKECLPVNFLGNYPINKLDTHPNRNVQTKHGGVVKQEK